MMRAGQVGILTKHPGWYGRMVQIVTLSHAYHVITAIDEFTAIEATVPRVRRVKISDYENCDVVWSQIDMTDAQINDAIRFLTDQLRRPYAYVDIFLLLIAKTTKRATPMWIVRRVSNRRQWFCSELADAGLIAAGVNLFPDRPECTVTPADFLTAVQTVTEETT